ncbi:hypothetical protein BG011_006662 [Mortierella polycephala]|uniref:Sin3-associated polypeptide Sap18 n=1 Tax=Mortierella polycephala TaxID=41804 RepID=A0A9P6QAU9_9FUNG|nr:hypothetical protein BG011_006662 [Mortierella polycephala]
MPETQTELAPERISVPTTLEEIDREKLCPFLLRMYYRNGQHHRADDFSPTSTPPPAEELRLYTWKSATLGEITSLVKQAIPDVIDLVGPSGQLAFRHVYLDTARGTFVGRDVGTVRLDNVLIDPSSASTLSQDIAPKEGYPIKDHHHRGSSIARSGAGGASIGSKSYEKTLGSIKFVIGDYLDIAVVSHTTPGFLPPRILQQSSGGPMRNRGGPRSGRYGGGGNSHSDRRTNPMGDRFAGRLGSSFGRESHNDSSWKGRGRGR